MKKKQPYQHKCKNHRKGKKPNTNIDVTEAGYDAWARFFATFKGK